MRRRYLAIALGSMLALAGCTEAVGPAPGFSLPAVSDGDGTTAGTAEPDEPVGTSVPTGQSSDQGGYVSATDRAKAAAESAIGGQYGAEEFGLTMKVLTSRAESVEQLIGECMAAAGFEYVPVDFTTIRRAMTSDKSAPGMSSGEYLRQFGHGITTQPEKPIVRIGLGDRNRSILDALPETDQVAYLRTLFGEDTNATLAFALESEDFSRTGGCTRAAIEQVFEAHELSSTYFNPADALILQDPRAIAALEAYAACMSEAGFVYRHPDDVDIDLQIRYDALVQGRDPDELTGAALTSLQALQEEERQVAVASDGCEIQHLEPVLDRIEEEFYGRS